MLRIILLAMVAALVGCASFNPQPPYTQAMRSSLLVDSDGGSGSAVIVNDQCALTAKHVADGATNLKVVTWTEKEYPVSKVYLSEFADIAVVCIAEQFIEKPVVIRRQMPEPYSGIFVVGNPLGIRNTITTGLYQGDDRMTAPIAWGNSGGGVFDQSGQLVGIAVAVSVRRIEAYVFVFPHLGVMETSRNLVQFLDENHIRYTGV